MWLNHEEIQYKQTTYNQVEFIIKKLTTNKFPGQDSIIGEFYEIFREESTFIPKLFQQIDRKECILTPSMRPVSPWNQNKKKTPQKKKKKGKLKASVTEANHWQMQKSSLKYKQTELNNSLEGLYTITSVVYPRNKRLVQ